MFHIHCGIASRDDAVLRSLHVSLSVCLRLFNGHTCVCPLICYIVYFNINCFID